MRLTVPPLEIAEDEGFSEDKDIFKRKGFGERLSNLIENTDGEMVIALHAPWGEGKSTFIKMWRGYLNNNGIRSIYFDAFENDYQSAPFLALAGEIYNLIDDKKKAEKSRFENMAVSALKTTGRIGLRIGIKALTAGVLDGTELGKHGTDKDISKEASDVVDTLVSSHLKSVSKDKENISNFKKYLEGLPSKLSNNGKPIVFIIDELDRCKPPFALEIIEIIKHLFAVPNITFVLVMNKIQLEASVRNEYGTVEASKYLQKFINLWISLPKNKDLSVATRRRTYQTV
jgi:predicted KAP-like P-loop ATPase